MTNTLKTLADLVGGKLLGNAELEIHAARPISEAGPGHITFLSNDKYLRELTACNATAAIVPETLSVPGKAIIQVADPLMAFVTVFRRFQGIAAESVHGIDAMASVHSSAIIGPDASIHAFTAVGAGSTIGRNCRLYSGAVVGRNCRVGDDVVLHPHAVLYDGSILGNRVIIHSNTVIGADGFGYRFENGRQVKVPQLGYVEIGDDVEIGACSTIDRGTFGPTRIGTGTKIDNLVMVAHNCQVGRHNIFVSQMGMAGSSSTGDCVTIAGQVGIVEHVHIGAGSAIGGQAAVIKDVPPDSRMLGSPATPEKEQKRILMSLMKLPEFRKDLKIVQDKLGLAG